MPAKLTPAVQAKILQAVAAGSPRRFVAPYAGISVSTLTNWLEWGRREWLEWEAQDDPDEKPGEYASFAMAFDTTEAQFIVAVLAKIRTLGEGAFKKVADKIAPTWQSLAWLLERKYPEEFGSHTGELAELRARVIDLLKQLGQPPKTKKAIKAAK